MHKSIVPHRYKVRQAPLQLLLSACVCLCFDPCSKTDVWCFQTFKAFLDFQPQISCISALGAAAPLCSSRILRWVWCNSKISHIASFKTLVEDIRNAASVDKIISVPDRSLALFKLKIRHWVRSCNRKRTNCSVTKPFQAR